MMLPAVFLPDRMTTTPASECSESGGGGGAVGTPPSGRPSQLPVRPLWPAHLGSAPHAYTPFFISNILGLPRPSAFSPFRLPAAYPAAEEEPLNLTVRSPAGGGSPAQPEGKQEHAPAVTEVNEVKSAGKAIRKGEWLAGEWLVCLCLSRL